MHNLRIHEALLMTEPTGHYDVHGIPIHVGDLIRVKHLLLMNGNGGRCDERNETRLGQYDDGR